MPRPTLPPQWRVQIVSGHRSRAIGKIEVTENRGQLVDYVVDRDGGTHGDFYCCHAVATTFADMLGKASPIIMSGSCSQQRARAKQLGALRTRAQFEAARKADPMSVAGWIVLVIDATAAPRPEEKAVNLTGHAHHTGVVGEIEASTGQIVVNGKRGGFYTIEANAADPEKAASRNGDGWYHGRERGHPDDNGMYEFIDPAAFP